MSSACMSELAFKSCKRAPYLESSSSLMRALTNVKHSLADKTLPSRTPRCSVTPHSTIFGIKQTNSHLYSHIFERDHTQLMVERYQHAMS
jgi:hypothetical protein